MSWTQAKAKYPMLSPFKDADRDGVKNWLDCKPFDKKRQGWAHSGKPGFRERTAHIKMMRPEKFLRTTYRETQNKSENSIKKESFEKYKDRVLNKEWSGSIEELKNVIKDKRGKMEVPYLEYDEQGRPIGHEGRHRAAAAKELGVKLMPVTISRRLKPKDYRDWKNRREDLGAKEDWKKELENEDEVISSESADIPIKEQREYGEEKPEALKELDAQELIDDVEDDD